MLNTTSVTRQIQTRLDDLRITLKAGVRPWLPLPSKLGSWSGWSTIGRMLVVILSGGLKVVGVALGLALAVPVALCVLLLTGSHLLSERVKSGEEGDR